MESLAALGVRAFRYLAAVYTINELGNWIGDVALAILVFDRTGSPLATAGLFLALRFAPAVIAPALTARVEVFSPRRILPVLYMSEAVIFAAIAVLAGRFSLPAVLVLAALDGVLAVAAKALIRSVNAAVLSDTQLLRKGNAVLNLGMTIGGALGPALAGVLTAAAGAGAALLVDAATFVAVAAIIAVAPDMRMESDRQAGTFGRLRAGLGEVFQRPPQRRLLLGAAVAIFFAAAVVPIEVVFAKRTLGAGDSGYGLLIASWGLGMLIGGVAFASASRLRITIVTSAGISLIGAGYAGLAASPDLFVACLFSVIGGIGNGIWWVAVVTALQQAIPSHAQGTVMGVLEGVNQLMPALGFILGGAVTAISSPRIAYALSAVGIGAVLVWQTVSATIRARSGQTTTSAP